MTASSDFTLYVKPSCPNCDQVKARLREYGLTYQESVIGQDISREDLLARFPWARVAPVIIDNKKNGFILPAQIEMHLKEHYDQD